MDLDTTVMQRPYLYSSPEDCLRHCGAVYDLAAHMQRTPQEVAATYEDELEQMQRRAMIADYLPVLVSKRVAARMRLLH